MTESFGQNIAKAFEAAARHRDIFAKFRHNASESPILLALLIIDRSPGHLDAARSAGLKTWGMDLDDRAQVQKFEPRSVTEAQSFIWWANRQQIYRTCLELIDAYSAELSGMPLAVAVCEAFLEAAERHLYTIALDFAQLRKKLPKQDFPAEELSKVLGGIVATRIKLYPRLRTALDERRAHSRDKSAKRERFEQLLAELSGVVLEVWEEAVHPLATLSEIRTEVVRRLEKKPQRERAAQSVLAEFELRERAREEFAEYDLVRQIGLSKRELQVWYLDQWLGGVIGPNTQTKAGITSTQLGIEPSTIRRYRKRAKDKIESYKRAAGL